MVAKLYAPPSTGQHIVSIHCATCWLYNCRDMLTWWPIWGGQILLLSQKWHLWNQEGSCCLSSSSSLCAFHISIPSWCRTRFLNSQEGAWSLCHLSHQYTKGAGPYHSRLGAKFCDSWWFSLSWWSKWDTRPLAHCPSKTFTGLARSAYSNSGAEATLSLCWMLVWEAANAMGDCPQDVQMEQGSLWPWFQHNCPTHQQTHRHLCVGGTNKLFHLSYLQQQSIKLQKHQDDWAEKQHVQQVQRQECNLANGSVEAMVQPQVSSPTYDPNPCPFMHCQTTYKLPTPISQLVDYKEKVLEYGVV